MGEVAEEEAFGPAFGRFEHGNILSHGIEKNVCNAGERRVANDSDFQSSNN